MHGLVARVVALGVMLGAGWLGARAQSDPPIPAGDIRIHYHRPDGAYTGWTVYAYDQTTEDTGNYGGGPVTVTGTDAYGAYFDVGITSGAQEVGLILHDPSAPGGDVKDPGPNEFVDPATEGNEYWAWSGIGKLYTVQPDANNPTALPAGYARIHYYRPDGNYANWSVYAFGDTAEYTGDYNSGLQFITGTDSYGPYFDLKLSASPADLGFIVHNVSSGAKDPGPDMHLAVNQYTQAWVITGNATVFTSQPSQAQILASLLGTQQAFWMDRGRVAIQQQFAQAGGSYALNYSLTGGLQVGTGGITGGGVIVLTAGGELTAAELAKYPQLSGYAVLQVDGSVPVTELATALKGQLALSVVNSAGALTYATGLQIAPVLDDLFAYAGKLGVVVKHGSEDASWNDFADDANAAVKLKVWAPTAQSVSLALYQSPGQAAPVETVPMHEHNGVWVAKGPASWKGMYYLYDVNVWVPADAAVDFNQATDPYSIDLAVNGTLSRITDLEDSATMPGDWAETGSPALASLSDMSLYELHVRDFSVDDPSVPEAHRGTYEAFADEGSNAMTHMRVLAQSGLKAVHILPSFHFASVNEDKTKWIIPTGLENDPPNSEEQQAAVTASQASPAYNWGYDPVHYMAPEGAYAINPDDRVLEYRTMVEGLHKAGLRVVQDVVFNHTSSAGESSNQPLDLLVPGYYHREDANGAITNSSCCADMASEHQMTEKLMIDTLLLNAKEYKIDGFRFDEMYQHFLYNMADIRAALRALTPEADGVDGSKIYIYGEGFNAGNTANNALGPAASQLNLYGYGIGTFNDRIRDGIRGPLGDLQAQGFATGLYTDSSAYTEANPPGESALGTLKAYEDLIRVGLTGNLRDYTLVNGSGQTVTGAQVGYNGVPAGYTATPIEAVNYCSVHDNEDWFDAVETKSNLHDTIETRARRAVLGMSLVALGEGVPFFQGGDDLLRSKDMDTNSYNSGDWFNKIDWTGRTANWGIGLPVASQNQSQWPIMEPLLSNAMYTPGQRQIAYASEQFHEMLEIRYSSGLFRMATEPEIQQRLSFLNTGKGGVPGLVVEKLDADGGSYGPYAHVVVVWNAQTTPVTYTDPKLKGLRLYLHPVQAHSMDAATKASIFNEGTGTVTVEGLTTAVFVANQ